jgi:hypothetical protein
MLGSSPEPPEEVEVRSGSDPSVVYTLRRYPPDGLWHHVDALCKGFSYRQHCRHVEEQEAKSRHDSESAPQ